MISAQAYARAQENYAKQALAVMGRTALNYVTKGAFGAIDSATNVAKEVKESQEPNLI